MTNYMSKQYWLLKTEPTSFSIDDLEKAPNKTTHWEGVRNYQARNFLRDQIKKGDEVFFYHSSTDSPAIVGTAKVTRSGYPDESQYNSKSKYYDPTATTENPRWFLIDIQHQKTYKYPISIQNLREIPALSKMKLLQKGMRLSVQPVTSEEWSLISKLSKEKP